MRNNLIFSLSIVIFAMLQVVFTDYLKIFNVKPDLLLIIISLGSLALSLRWALVLSVFAGLFKDIFGMNMFGINTLLFPVWSFLIIKLAKKISIDNNYLRLGLIFIIALIHNTFTGLVSVYSGSFIPPGIFLRIVFVGSLYVAVISPLVFKIINSVCP